MILLKLFNFKKEFKMKNSIGLIAFLSICLFWGCAGNKNIVSKKNNDGNLQTSVIHYKNIPPGHCRIAGTIISIDSNLEKDSSKDPCSIKPCNTRVRVDSIIGYGSAFPPLLIGQIIRLHFYFTISPTTKDLIPNMSEFYTGLNTGDSFIGDITVSREINSNNKLRQFAIYGYQKK